MTGRHAQTGFTLAELLGGLAVAAILVLPLADMLRAGTESARTVRAALDLNADARFALDRIAANARAVAAMPPVPVGVPTAMPVGAKVDPASWFAPIVYAVVGTDLVERDTSVSPARVSIIASNVESFQLATPEVVAGRPLLGITLRLTAEGNSVTGTRTVRVARVP